MKFTIAISFLLNAAVVFSDFCGVGDSVATANNYVIYNNLWGENAALSGSQCTGLDNVNGIHIGFHTNWNWVGGSHNVKSYANAELVFAPEMISSISKIKSTVKYAYEGTSDAVADVAYDLFFAPTPSGDSAYEVMIWLAAYNGAGPISAHGSSIANVTLSGHPWDLYQGYNGATSVFSFVVVSGPITSFSGDIMPFLNYLVENQGIPSSYYFHKIQFGTEPFTGTNASLIVSSFSAVLS